MAPHSLLRSRMAAFVLAGALLAGCGGTAAIPQAPLASPEPTAVDIPASPEPTAAAAPTDAPTAATAAPNTPVADDEEQTKAGIQQALDLYAQAYNDNNPELLKQAADQTNAPFRRFIQTRFETYQESIFAGGGGYAFSVKSIKPRDLGFVEVQVEAAGGAVADWTFRQVNGVWVMSEPTKSQIGKREKIESEHFTFYVYPWSDDVNQTLMTLMENARSRVQAKLGKVPSEKTNVYVKPIFGEGKIEDPQALAYAQWSSQPRMTIFAPRSYVFQFYDPDVGWEKELEDTLTHEYTHITNNSQFTSIARMSDWMYEGLAEYVADSPRSGEVREALRSNQIIPIIDPTRELNRQDLEHIYSLKKDVSLAYGLSYELVAYINEKYGGMEGFWKLVQAFDTSRKLDTALQQSFGISYEQFDQEWRAWMEEKY